MRAFQLFAVLAFGMVAFLGAPAISFAADQGQTQKTKPGAATPKAQSGGLSVAVPLTIAECGALGGDVNAKNQACTDKNQFTCTTTTIRADGVIESHSVCIDK